MQIRRVAALITVAFAALLSASIGAAAERPTLRFCIDLERDRAALRSLNRWVHSATLSSLPADRCGAPSAGLFLARFESRNGRIFLVIDSAELSLDRSAPWLSEANQGLARLAEAGRLSELAVLIEAILAEFRALRKAVPREEVATAMAPPPATPPAPAPSAPLELAAPVNDPLPRQVPAAEVDVNPGRELSLSSFAGWAWRNPSQSGPLVGAEVGWSGLSVLGDYSSGTPWKFQGLPLEVRALTLTVGWTPTLLQRGSFGLSARLGVTAEGLWLRSADVAGAPTHLHGDLGLTIGAAGAWRLGAFELGPRLMVSWFPAGHWHRWFRVEDGQATSWSTVAVSLQLAGSWIKTAQ